MKKHTPAFKKFFSMAMAFVLVFGLFPTSAVAVEDASVSDSPAMVEPAASEDSDTLLPGGAEAKTDSADNAAGGGAQGDDSAKTDGGESQEPAASDLIASAVQPLGLAPLSEGTPAVIRDAREFPIDDDLQAFKLVISDSSGDHTVDWKQGDSTDIDLGTIERNAQLSIKLVFDPNEVTGNDKDNSNPTVYGDTFTCTVPDILSNANGGKWEGVLKDQTTNYGIANDRVGEFTIENGKLTIKFDEGYVEETAGNIKNASLAFNGAFDSYGWDESSFSKTLYFGSLPIKVTFPAETAKRNITVEKAVERYGKSDFSSSYGSQGKTALNGSPKVDADGYVSYSIKAKADDGNNVPLENVIISDTFTTDNVDLSTITLTSVVRTAGATDTDITSSAVEQKSGDAITGWNVGTLNNGEEVLLTFKVKIDKDAITADVDAAKQANGSTSATDERSLKNTASVSADKTPAVTADETATLQNYMTVRKSTTGSYDADADRQLFTITVTAPSDNKYTQTNVSVRDAPQVPNVAKPYVKDAGIQSITIVRADGTTETGTQDNPLYNNFSFDKGATTWQAFIDKMAPGDVATITAYMDFDEGIFTELGSGTSTSGYSGISNYAYICDLGMNGDLSTAYHYSYFSVYKTWITKSAASITSDGIIRWTATGNSYSSLYPQANCAGMKVKDDLGSNLEFVDDYVLVKFSRHDAATDQDSDVVYAGDDAENGYLKVLVNGTSFEFNVPDGYGDCKFTIAYDTKVTNNFGPAAYYYNNIGLDKWKYRASTYRPRIATMEKSQVVHGPDWTDWQTKVFGPVSTNDTYTDTITGNTDVMYMNDDQIAGIKLTFNGAVVDANLYTIEPTVITSGKYSGYKITFNGPIQSTDDAGKTITPTNTNPLYIDYRTQTELPVPAEGASGTSYKYGNTGVISVGGNEDTDSDFYFRANKKDISKVLKSFNGSSLVWTVTVNRYGESSVPTKEGCDNYNMLNGVPNSADNTVTFTETLPAGLRFVAAKVTGYGSDSKVAPTVEVLDQVQNADGTSTVTLRVNKVTHFECNKNYYSSSGYDTWHNFVWVNVDIETQIVDKEFLLDTTDKQFQWTNTASVVTRDGIPFSASADANAQHVAMTKEMAYTAATAPYAQFSIDMNTDKCDLNPDGDTVKVYDKSSPTLVVDTGSIKVINATTKQPVDFLLDAGQMAVDGTFSLEVPDNVPLKITYAAYVSGVKDDNVAVSNVAYFEGAELTEITSRIEENVVVLASEASAESDVMVWLKKMSASGEMLGACKYQLEEYKDGAWVMKTPEIVTVGTGAGAKVGGLDKNVLYRLTETEAAEGYVLDETPVFFCLKVNQDSVVAMPDDIDTSKIFFCSVAARINAYNNPYVDVKFSKTGIDDVVVSGANFKVVDANGITVKDKDGEDVEFTSDSVAELRTLAPGSYQLVETAAPAGYLIADPIDFVVNVDKTVSVNGQRVTDNTVVCKETPTAVSIKKMARTAAGPLEPLAGAKLQIKDGDTVVVDTWETTEDAKQITGVLATGKTYTIHEVEAPTGYLLADDIEFTIADDGTVEALTDRGKQGEIYVVDTKPSIDIKKVDADTNAQLGGVTLTLKKGEEVIRTWTTSATSAEQFDNLEVGTTYTVSEDATLPGYTKIDDFTFTPNSDGTFTVTGDAASWAAGSADPDDFDGIPNLGIGVPSRDCGVLTVKNAYTPTPVDVTLSASKAFTGVARPSEKTFSFELKDADVKTVDTKSVTGEGAVDFKKLTFSKGGTYNYTISEVHGGDVGYTYDTTVHAVEVTVADDGQGTLTPTVKVDGVVGSTASFTNTYTPTKTNLSIPVSKTFSEDSAVRPTSENFTFTITAAAGTPLPAATTVTATEQQGAAFGDITYTEAGTYTYTITETNDGKAGYTYAAPKTVTVEVEDTGGALAATWSIGGVDRATAIFENGYAVTPTSVALPVEKIIDGVGYGADSAFDFLLTSVDDAPMPVEGDTVSIASEGAASFGDIEFTAAGTYTYKVSEVDGHQPGFSYDKAEYTVVVTVVDEESVLKASWVATTSVPNGADVDADATEDDADNEGADGDANDDAAATDEAPLVFENVYRAQPVMFDLPVAKAIDGQGYPTDAAFTFTLTPEDDAPMPPSGDSVTITGVGTVGFEGIRFTQSGTYGYTVSEVAGNLSNFAYDSAVRKIVVTVDDNDSVLSVTWTVDGATADAVTFTNRYVAPSSPSASGRTGDLMPVGGVFGVLAVSFATVVIARRRRAKA